VCVRPLGQCDGTLPPPTSATTSTTSSSRSVAAPGNNNEGVSSGGGSLTLIVALAAGGACALCLCVIAVVVLLRQKEGDRTPTIGVETEQAPPKPARTSQVVPQYASPRDTMLSASTGSAFDSSLEEPPAQYGQLQLAPHGLTSHTGLINEDEPQEEYQAIPDERDDDYAPVPADAIHDPRMSNAGAFHTGDTWTSGDGGTIDQPTSEFMFH